MSISPDTSIRNAAGIAKVLSTQYFPMLSSGDVQVSNFYSQNAKLIWDNQTISGNLEIHSFLKSVKKARYSVSTLDFQFVYDQPNVYMIICTGVASIYMEAIRQFHCVFYVRAKSPKQALIEHQVFTFN